METDALEPFRWMRTRTNPALVFVTGPEPLRRFLRSRYIVSTIVFKTGQAEEFSADLASKHPPPDLHFLSKSGLCALVGYRAARGALAYGPRPVCPDLNVDIVRAWPACTRVLVLEGKWRDETLGMHSVLYFVLYLM
jgi:hypothetical protein